MFWPFSRSDSKLASRVTSLEAEVGAMRVSYADAISKVLAVIERIEGRYQVKNWRDNQETEKAELREILGQVDIPSLMRDPAKLSEALKNPALINFALKKFAKEMI